jgi:hypothetical protein
MVQRRKRRRRVLVVLGAVLALAIAACLIGYVVLDSPRPVGTPGPRADALAARIEASVAVDAWERTGAVRWDFDGRQEHLWDRRRNVSRVRWGDIEVQQSLDARRGRAWEAGREVEGARLAALLDDAWTHHCNDSFWLNPLAKLRDPGVTRSLVRGSDGTESLLVSYASGGVTPGDAYLWRVGDDGRPIEWQMWVSVLPIGGVTASWEGWTSLSTGTVISTRHELGPMTLELGEVVGATTLDELEPGDDPFAPLVEAGIIGAGEDP